MEKTMDNTLSRDFSYDPSGIEELGRLLEKILDDIKVLKERYTKA